MTEIKNILIIGGIGVGKTTLANVLSGTDRFKEDSSSGVEIRRTKAGNFEVNGTKYRIIDTVGLGDTKLNEEELLEKFEEEVGTYIDEGISQIFLVMNGRLDERVLTEYLWLNEFLFDKKAFDYTIIVRNNFNCFKNKKERKKDTEKLINNLADFFNGIDKNKEFYKEINEKFLEEGKIIHVNNPPIDDVDDEEELEDNKEWRQDSKKILLSCFNNKESYKTSGRKWLDEKYPKDKRTGEIILDLSKQGLKGALRLKGFTKLEWVNCSDNQLTNLDLSDCKNLVELRCNGNQFVNWNFLKSVIDLEKLEIQNNQKISLQNLKILQKLTKLKELHITNINLGKGLEHLPASCEKLYCSSEEVIEELDKNNCSDNDKYGVKYYNLDKWRETDKQNKLTAKVIPSERLFVIRSNIKKFINKWGKEAENSWYEVDYWKKQQSPQNKAIILSKLKHPNDFSKFWWLTTGVQWTNRASSVVGGSLLLVGTSQNNDQYTETGGIIAIVSPFVEIITSQINDKVYEAREKKWEEFMEDTKNLLDNYHELLGIVEKITILKLGEVNKRLKDLKIKTKAFLKEYDKDGNGTIDVSELIEKRDKLALDLNKEKAEQWSSQLGGILQAIIELETELVKYRQNSSLMEADEEEQLENQIVNQSAEETRINMGPQEGSSKQVDKPTERTPLFEVPPKHK